MEHTTNLFCLCAIFTLGAVIAQNFARGVNNRVTASKYSSPDPAMIIECETPNGGPGICVDIRVCRKLLEQLTKRRAWAYIRASKCGSYRDFSPKVCCGEDDDFKNATSDTHKKTLTSVVVESVSQKSCGRQRPLPSGHKIVGGRPAFIGEFPWMALILHKNQYGTVIMGCAGFLIHTKYVITAAHCTHINTIKQKGPIISVLLGEHNIETSTDCTESVCAKNIQNINIDKIIVHSDYDPIKIEQYNDISIIRLVNNVLLTDYVQPICLLVDDNQFSTSYFVSGWGRTATRSHSKIKMVVELPSFNKTECNKKYAGHNLILSDSQICAGGREMEDSCNGDSGGPLMIQKNDETWFAAGIVSFGMGCGMQGWPGVYTDIVKFLPWIKSQMAR